MTTVRKHLLDAATRLGDDEGAAEARLLLEHVTGQSSGWLYLHADDELDDEWTGPYAELVERRRQGTPVAYLTGMRGFWTLDLRVTPAVLIPRPETELLVELAVRCIPADAAIDIADLGTGSGAIALAIASERRNARLLATDASKDALVVAADNARRLGIANVAFAEGNWTAALGRRKFALIASNPPYIAEGDTHLMQGDLRFEPAAALASGRDGLDAIRTITAAAPAHLIDGGWLLFEHGWDQGEVVRRLLVDGGFGEVDTHRDLGGRDRVTLGRWTGPT